MAELRVPEDLVDGSAEPVISAWFVRDGEHVQKDDLLAELMVEKVAIELRAPAGGVVRRLVEPEVPVFPGQVVATIS